MKTTKFTVIKKSAGYGVKSFNNEEAARAFAAKCCQANNNDNYIVCVYECGLYHEI